VCYRSDQWVALNGRRTGPTGASKPGKWNVDAQRARQHVHVILVENDIGRVDDVDVVVGADIAVGVRRRTAWAEPRESKTQPREVGDDRWHVWAEVTRATVDVFLDEVRNWPAADRARQRSFRPSLAGIGRDIRY